MSGKHLVSMLTVESLAAGGEGVAHVAYEGERRTVFLPRTAPGDEVRAEIDFATRPARAGRVEIVSASPHRIVPSCPAAQRCGGCDWMHLAPSAQLAGHADRVRAALERVSSLPEMRVHAAPATERYRTRARLFVEAAVSKRSGRAQGAVRVGLRGSRSHRLEPVDACLVLDPRLEPTIGLLARLLEGEVGRGEAHVALGASERPVLSLSWDSALSGPFFARVERLVQERVVAGVEVALSGARMPARIGDPSAETLGGDGQPLRVPAASFAQANPAVSLALVRRAIDLLEPSERSVVELFAGAGNFTVALAPLARSLVAVEADRAAVAAARANAASRGLSVRLVEADADRFDLPSTAESVLLDPPRAGASGAATRIASSRVGRVLYVSCDPSTLARDVGVLVSAGFALDALETFEMFPHTSHVEVVALLTRARGAPRRNSRQA